MLDFDQAIDQADSGNLVWQKDSPDGVYDAAHLAADAGLDWVWAHGKFYDKNGEPVFSEAWFDNPNLPLTPEEREYLKEVWNEKGDPLAVLDAMKNLSYETKAGLVEYFAQYQVAGFDFPGGLPSDINGFIDSLPVSENGLTEADIQYLRDNSGSEEEFLAALNSLPEDKKDIIVAEMQKQGIDVSLVEGSSVQRTSVSLIFPDFGTGPTNFGFQGSVEFDRDDASDFEKSIDDDDGYWSFGGPPSSYDRDWFERNTNFTDEQIDYLIDRFDFDGDGKIEYNTRGTREEGHGSGGDALEAFFSDIERNGATGPLGKDEGQPLVILPHRPVTIESSKIDAAKGRNGSQGAVDVTVEKLNSHNNVLTQQISAVLQESANATQVFFRYMSAVQSYGDIVSSLFNGL